MEVVEWQSNQLGCLAWLPHSSFGDGEGLGDGKSTVGPFHVFFFSIGLWLALSHVSQALMIAISMLEWADIYRSGDIMHVHMVVCWSHSVRHHDARLFYQSRLEFRSSK